MNLPNVLSLSRIVMTGLFVCLYPLPSPAAQWATLGLFALAALTDWLDGYLARRLQLITPLGKLLDPLADKVMVAAAFVLFSSSGVCPAWATILIVFREFAVTGLRLIAVEQRVVIAADQFGKWKTAFQMIYCLVVLLCQAVPGLSTQTLLVDALLWGSVALTLLSGLAIMLKSRRHVKFS